MPEELVTLLAPVGTDEVNHGTQRYWVNRDDRTVRVPRAAVAPLLKTGGCTLPKQEVAIPHGHVKVRHHRDPDARCSGTPLEDGSTMVPVGDVGQLASHGFYPLDDKGNLVGAPQGKQGEDGQTVQTPAADPALIQKIQDLEAANADLQARLKAAGTKSR